jgi:hypothetical protein
MNWPIAQWNDFINQKREGKESTIIDIEIRPEVMIIYLDNDVPLIIPCWESTPKDIGCFPILNDNIVVEGDGENIPIVYNKSANAYLLSKYSDKIIGLEQKLIGKALDLTGIRKQLEIQMESDLIVRFAKQVGEYAKLFLLRGSDRLIKLPGFLSTAMERYKTIKNRDKESIEAIISGSMVFIKKFSFKESSQSNYYNNYIFSRIYSNELKSFVSILYIKNKREPLKKIFIPPDNSKIEVIGKLNLNEGFLLAKDIKYGGKSIF